MTQRINVGDLQVAAELHDFINREVLPDVGIDSGRFWKGFSSIVTELVPLANYFPAEPYHQDFFERNPNQGYCMAVAAPKVAKFRKTFARLARS